MTKTLAHKSVWNAIKNILRESHQRRELNIPTKRIIILKQTDLFKKTQKDAFIYLDKGVMN